MINVLEQTISDNQCETLMTETLATLDSFVKPLTTLINILEFYHVEILDIFNKESPVEYVENEDSPISKFRLLSSLFVDTLQMTVSIVDTLNIDDLLNYLENNKEFFRRLFTSGNDVCLTLKSKSLIAEFKENNIYKVFELLDSLTNLNIDYKVLDSQIINIISVGD